MSLESRKNTVLEDPAHEMTDRLQSLWDRFGRLALGVLAAIVVLGVGYYFTAQANARRENDASARLSEANQLFWQGDYDRSRTMSEEVAKQLRATFGATDTAERQYGIKLLATRLGRFDETLRLPRGWQVAKLPDPVDIDGPSASLKFSAEVTGRDIHYTCELTVKKWTVPPEDYANYKEVIEKFQELTGYVLACELEGSHE